MTARFTAVTLRPHPAQPPGPVRALAASGTLDADGRFTVEFDLRGELRALRLAPRSEAPARRDGLWRHSCFECFAAREAQAAYLELNFSPSGDWAAYHFTGYRAVPVDLAAAGVEVTARPVGHDRLQVIAEAKLATALAPGPGERACATWSMNLAAVIEDVHGSLWYWAVHHPRGQPDFHDRDGFRVVPSAA